MAHGGIPLSEWSGSGATQALHETIKQQIEVMDKQSKAIGRLTVLTIVLAVIQTVAAVIQIWPLVSPAQAKFEPSVQPAPVAPVATPTVSQPSNLSPKLEVKPFTVKLKGGDNYLQTTMVWSLGSSSDKELLQRFDVEIRHTLLLLFSSKSLSQISGEKAQAKLGEEIRNSVNQVVGSKSAVKEVFFVSFIAQ